MYPDQLTTVTWEAVIHKVNARFEAVSQRADAIFEALRQEVFAVRAATRPLTQVLTYQPAYLRPAQVQIIFEMDQEELIDLT